MRLLVVNPNATAAMTAKIGAAARAVASPGTEILAQDPGEGPVSIEGYVDEAYAVPGMLDVIRRADHAGIDAHIIACFDDTGLDAARSLLSAPVVGIGEAGAKAASFLANRFCVVTTLSISVPILQDNLRRYGLAERASVRAKIGRLYHGWAHVALIYAIGLAAIWYFARQVTAPAWYEWLVVPVAFLGANIFEWWIHKYVMHRPIKGLMGIYKRHTLAHHQFFTDQEPFADNGRDFRITFFPPYALVTFLVMSVIGAAFLALVWSSNSAWLLICTTTAVYLNYEFFQV